MSIKERERKVIFEQVISKVLSLPQACAQLHLSYRHTKRLFKRYRLHGDLGLVHAARGKPSSRAYDPSFKSKVLDLYQTHLMGFGPTLASETLFKRFGLNINRETLRLWLNAEGLSPITRKRKPYRQWREPKAQFGQLVQIDGSFFDWFNRSDQPCLMNFVDDATSISYAQLAQGESTFILLTCLGNWIQLYGIPQAVYVDRKSVYIAPSHFSVFQQVCQRLGIQVIQAYSPQAKGRVERKHAVFQDRLTKELALEGIQEIDQANAFLEQTFLPDINKRFAKAPKDPQNAHRPADVRGPIDQLIYWCEQRTVQNDYCIMSHNQYFQLNKTPPITVRAKQKVEVRTDLTGEIKVFKDDKELSYTVLKERPVKEERKCLDSPRKRSQRARQSKRQSSWSRYNPGWLSGSRQNV